MLILKDFQENIAINFATDTFKQKSNKLQHNSTHCMDTQPLVEALAAAHPSQVCVPTCPSSYTLIMCSSLLGFWHPLSPSDT